MFRTIGSVLLLVSLSLAAVACGDDDDSGAAGSSGSSGASGSSGSGGSGATGGSGGSAGSTGGDATKGAAVAQSKACSSCHGADYSGGIGPNITSSKTAGIGNWTDAQLAGSINDGTNKDGEPQCSQMQKYGLSDGDMADLIAFLRATKAVDTANEGTGCP